MLVSFQILNETTTKINRLFLCFVYFFSVPMFTLEALVGETIYLPCNVSTHEVGDDVVLVLWYREDKISPIYR